MTDPQRGPEPEPTEGVDEHAEAAEVPTGSTPEGSAASEAPASEVPDDLESLAADTLDRLEAVTAERDDYLDRLRRLQADFENFKKRSARDHQVAGERAAGRLAEALLPVLDACDAALLHGAEGVQPIFAALLGVLEKEGLGRIDPLDQPFDPAFHEAVMHEHGEADQEGPVVVEVLRPGYAWKDTVLRAAMVKVRG